MALAGKITSVPSTRTYQGANAIGYWSPNDLGINNLGPLNLFTDVETPPLVVVGYACFTIHIKITGNHSVAGFIFICDPFTGVALQASGGVTPVLDIGNFVSGADEETEVDTCNINPDDPNNGAIHHTMILDFQVVQGPCFLTVSMRGSSAGESSPNF